MEVVVVKQRRHLEAFWEGVKKRGSKLDITSLNSHFPHQEPQHQMLRRKKAEPVTPHFLSLNQDIVAWSQKEKCGVCNAHSAVSKGSS
jgi:hypothetical protein